MIFKPPCPMKFKADMERLAEKRAKKMDMIIEESRTMRNISQRSSVKSEFDGFKTVRSVSLPKMKPSHKRMLASDTAVYSMSTRLPATGIDSCSTTGAFSRKYSGALADLANSYLKGGSPSRSAVSKNYRQTPHLIWTKAIYPDEKSIWLANHIMTGAMAKKVSIASNAESKIEGESVSKVVPSGDVGYNSFIVISNKVRPQITDHVIGMAMNEPSAGNNIDTRLHHTRSRSLGCHLSENLLMENENNPIIPPKLFNETVQFKRNNFNKFLKISRRDNIGSMKFSK